MFPSKLDALSERRIGKRLQSSRNLRVSSLRRFGHGNQRLNT